MTIVSVPASAQAHAALQGPLQFLFDRAPTGGAITNLRSTQPHRTYTVDLADLANGKFLEAAKAGVFRYLIIEQPIQAMPARPVAEAFVTDDAQATFAGMRVGPTTGATIEALLELEALPDIQAEDFELRYLEIPALRFHAIWLEGSSRAIVRPIDPTPLNLAAHATVSPATIQPHLQHAARAVLDAQARAAGASAG